MKSAPPTLWVWSAPPLCPQKVCVWGGTRFFWCGGGTFSEYLDFPTNQKCPSPMEAFFSKGEGSEGALKMPPLKLKIFGTKKFLYCRAEDVLIKKSVLERGNSFFMIYCIYLNNEFTCPAPILTSRYTTPSRRNSPNDHSNINLTLRNVIPHHRMRRKCWW